MYVYIHIIAYSKMNVQEMYEERGSIVYGRITTFIFKQNSNTFRFAFLKDAMTAQCKEFQYRESNHCRLIIEMLYV